MDCLAGDNVWQGAAGEELQEQQARCPLLQQGEQQGFKLEQVFRDCFKEFVLCSELDWRERSRGELSNSLQSCHLPRQVQPRHCQHGHEIASREVEIVKLVKKLTL